MTTYAAHRATVRMSTPAQRSFIESMLAERVLTGTNYEGWNPDWDNATFDAASAVIRYLKTLPRKATPKAEPGFYVTEGGNAVKVQANKAGTGTYALAWSGTSWDYAPGVARTLAGLTPMTGEEAARIGLASGRCIACAKTLGGETLTARVAALVGYGEICADKNGWAFPKGAAAQRQYLADQHNMSMAASIAASASRFD